MKAHWYFISEEECPICGCIRNVSRERRYDARPTEYEKRHEYIVRYDYCNER